MSKGGNFIINTLSEPPPTTTPPANPSWSHASCVLVPASQEPGQPAVQTASWGWARPVLSPEPAPHPCASSSRAPSRITSRGTSSLGTSCVTWQRRCPEVSRTCTRTCPGAVARATSRLSPTGTWVSSQPPCAWPGAAEVGGREQGPAGLSVVNMFSHCEVCRK